MSTGVTVSDEVAANFTEFKKASNKTTYIVYKIEDGKIVTEFTSGEGASFDEFLSKLPADDCRYALYSMDFTTNDGRPTNKLVSIAW
jgi:cofilin